MDIHDMVKHDIQQKKQCALMVFPMSCMVITQQATYKNLNTKSYILLITIVLNYFPMSYELHKTSNNIFFEGFKGST